ncbi:MAG TPA: (d)CMP kinase [Burkholderiales bacterium]|nr:(d)CMP kinase [Burkholderiales bacterium]
MTLNEVRAAVIAIDGPSASGKGTIASRVAQVLGFHYLESGALYRLVALVALREGLTDEVAIANAAEAMDASFMGEEIFLEDQEVSLQVRHEQVGTRASEIARMPAVRAVLLKRQRAFRRPPGLVADGRDMATVVFPEAELKVFLTATPEVRAERRYKQLIGKGIAANLASLSRDLEERDSRDRNRSIAPLVPASDSQVLDSSALSIEEVVERIVAWWREKEAKSGGRG